MRGRTEGVASVRAPQAFRIDTAQSQHIPGMRSRIAIVFSSHAFAQLTAKGGFL